MGRRGARAVIDTTTRIGSLTLPNPVMPASGTAGHATELGAYVELAQLGAFVSKSVAAFAWDGNAAPRVHETTAGMINSVGLQGPGLEAWLRDDLPQLLDAGVTKIVVSIWGRSVEEYALAAELLAAAPAEVVAVEVNLSCPNTESGRNLFAHDPAASASVLAVTAAVGRPRWAKLSPNTDRLVEVAGAVRDAGAEAVTLVNTLLAMAIDTGARRPILGNGGGGLSGPAMHPVAVRAVWDVHVAMPDLPIVGVGGIHDATTAVEMLMAGASALQIGTASFARPSVALDVLHDVEQWCTRTGVASTGELTGAAHG